MKLFASAPRFCLALCLAAPTAAPAATATPLSSGFAGVFGEVELSLASLPNGLDLVEDRLVPVPAGSSGASIGADLDRSASGGGTFLSQTGSGLTRAIVSIPAGASPQVEARAQAVVSQNPTVLNGWVGVDSAAALAYEAVVRRPSSVVRRPSSVVRRIGGPAGLTFGLLPLTADIFSFLSVETTVSSGRAEAFAGASAEVVLSDQPVTVGSRGTLIFERSRAEVLSRGVSSRDNGEGVFDPGLSRINVAVPLDTAFWIGKRAMVRTSVGVSGDSGALDGGFEATGVSEAVVDPVLSFDQSLFEQLYFAECAAAGLDLCPDAASLFAIELSPGVGNGFRSPSPAVIPLPGAGVLMLSWLGGLTALSEIARRHRARSSAS